MAKKKENEYFSAMIGMADYALQAASELDRLFCNFKASSLDSAMEPLHKTEHSADELMHTTAEKLIHEFITPIEREDISAILSQLDDVIDDIEDLAIKAYMYNITSITDEGVQLCEIIKKGTSGLSELMREFADFKKSKNIRDIIIKVNDLEGEADKIYADAVHRLFSEEKDAVKLIGWTKMYDGFEKCCDSIEHVCFCVETAILKNS